MDDEQQPKISYANKVGLVGTSIFFDIIEGLLDFIPLVGWAVNIFIDIFAFLTFYVWFKILGVSFVRTRRSLAFIAGFILGAIPFTSWFAWTLDVVLVIIDVNNEEKLAKFKKPMPRRGQTPTEQQKKGYEVGERFKRRYGESGAARRIIGAEISPK
jgi:hypothetical protein